MRVLAINGSHRKGNTGRLLKLLTAGLPAETIELRKHDIKPCDGNDYCVTAKRCRIRDDFKAIAAKMQAADVLVFASPSYFNNVTGRMKIFIDRCNVLWNSRALEGRKSVLCAIGADKANHVEGCLKALRNLAAGLHTKVLAQVMVEENNLERSMPQIEKARDAINAGI